jgi:hypothetical protein
MNDWRLAGQTPSRAFSRSPRRQRRLITATYRSLVTLPPGVDEQAGCRSRLNDLYNEPRSAHWRYPQRLPHR